MITKLCTHADFPPPIRELLSRDEMLSEMRRRDSGFPKGLRPYGRKSEPMFERRSILAWIKRTWGGLLPEMVAQIEKSDFVHPIAPKPRIAKVKP